MARITLVKGKTSITKRNVKDSLPTILTYANSVGLLVIALRVFDII